MGLSCCLSVFSGTCGLGFVDCVFFGIGVVVSVVSVGDVVGEMAAVIDEDGG